MCYSTFNIQHSIKHQPQIQFMLFPSFYFSAISWVMPISNLFYFQYLSSLVTAGCHWLPLCESMFNWWIRFGILINRSISFSIINCALCSVLHFHSETIFSFLFSSLSFPFGRSHFVIHWLCWLNILYSAKVCKVDGKIFMSFARV